MEDPRPKMTSRHRLSGSGFLGPNPLEIPSPTGGGIVGVASGDARQIVGNVSTTYTGGVHYHGPVPLEEKEACLQSLSFLNIDARLHNISSAHQDTCDWLFDTTEFRQWHDHTDLLRHNGVLWIKGNPGTGKSTLMKHILRYCQRFFDGHVIAAYFFNARGDSFEKTALGMLRSLVYQLLETEHSIFERFIPIFRDKLQKYRGKECQWYELELKEFILSEIQISQTKPLLLLVDALDECKEIDVRNVVKFLEELSVKAVHAKTTLKICLSSRHYPYISMKKYRELVVEKRKEHNDDITKYVRDELTKWDKKVEEAVLEKASGIFMWVVLVVAILNKAYDDGEIEAMHEELRKVPSDLEQVFETLLSNDNQKKHETILMLQCVLFARRLLTPEELFFAMKAGIESENLGAWDHSKVTPDVIRRRITSSSRGLIEVRKGRAETVQFIHESVNDFLLRHQRLQKLDPTLEPNPIGRSHDRLKSCCMSYIMIEALPLPENRRQAKDLRWSYPFLEYASTYVLDHSEEAEARNIGQAGFLQRLRDEDKAFERLRQFHNFLEPPGSGCIRGANLLYISSLHGHSGLVKILLLNGVNVNSQGGLFGTALQAAIIGGKNEIVEALLENGADVNARGGPFSTALQAAAFTGRNDIVAMLLQKGADANAQGGFPVSALQAAAIASEGISPTVVKEIITMLLEKGADVNTQGGHWGSALQAAAFQGRNETVAVLLEKGADVNIQGGLFGTALQAAASQGEMEIVAMLLEKGADINACGGLSTVIQSAVVQGEKKIWSMLVVREVIASTQGRPFRTAPQTAAFEEGEETLKMLLKKEVDINDINAQEKLGAVLQAAALNGEKDIVTMLLVKGADVNTRGGTALQAAAFQGEEEIVTILLEKGADVNAQGSLYYMALATRAFEHEQGIIGILIQENVHFHALGELNGTALQAAVLRGKKEIVAILIEEGADVNARGGLGTALQAAAFIGEEEVVAMLLKNGADINIQGGLFGTALQAAAYQGEVEIVEMLLENRADVNIQGGLFGTPLQAAVLKGKKEIVATLVKEGADVNAQAGFLGAPLQAFGLTSKRIFPTLLEEIMTILLDKGADVNAQGGLFGTALHAAASGYRSEFVAMLLEKGADINAQGGIGTPLQVAALWGDEENVATLLEKGADVNAQGGLFGTALQAAAYSRGRYKIVEMLLKKGADVNIQGGLFGTALQAAAFQGRMEIVAMLLEKGADVNAQGGRWGTALQAAIASNDFLDMEIVTTLLEKGADVNIQGGLYDTALQAAVFKGRYEIVALLLEKGANVNTQGVYGTALQGTTLESGEEVVAMKGLDASDQGGPSRTTLQAVTMALLVAVLGIVWWNGPSSRRMSRS